MKNKKASSHLEIILSFVIFLGFIFFMLIFFNPFQVSKGESSSLASLEREIQKNISIEVSSISLKLNDSLTVPCFEIDRRELNLSEKLSVKNQSGAKINASSENNIQIERDNSQFFYIDSSSEFTENPPQMVCTLIDQTNYTLGLMVTKQSISNSSMILFKESYENSYNSLKNYLSLPPSENFLISFRDTENNILMNVSRARSKNLRISASETPVTIVYENGNIKYALMHIEVW